MPGLRWLSPVLMAGLLAMSTPVHASAAAPVDRTSYLLDASYVVHIAFDWAARSLDVTTDMDAHNQSGGRISRLELNTLAARFGDIHLLEASVNGTDVNPEIHDQTLIVALPHVLRKHGHVSVHTRYRATLLDSVTGRDWFWTRTDGVATVYRSIPWLSRRMPFRQASTGDPFVTPVASMVRVTFLSSAGVQFATTGRKVASKEPGVTYEAHNVRDFNFAASRTYDVLKGRTLDGATRLRIMTRWATKAQARQILDVAQRAIARYEAWVGTLPCPTLTIAESAGGSAMESPCLVWIPRDAGAFSDYFVAHELAHQWFYAVVGNDQAQDPFLDESVADFMARTFTHQIHDSTCRKARLDRSIYDYDAACYYQVIYIQGSQFLSLLKADMGRQLFWQTMRTFWADHQYTVSSTFQLLEAFRFAAGDWVLPRFQRRFPSLYPS